jgi:hypothetical protein
MVVRVLFTELNKETVLVNKVNANLFRGMEAVGGKLTITNQRLMFTSHSLNIQAGTTEIPMSEIATVRKRNTMGFVPNGMSVILKNGTEHKFVVWKRDMLIKTIIDNMGS